MGLSGSLGSGSFGSLSSEEVVSAVSLEGGVFSGEEANTLPEIPLKEIASTNINVKMHFFAVFSSVLLFELILSFLWSFVHGVSVKLLINCFFYVSSM